MGKWVHIQRDFSRGIISPKLYLRQNEDFYKKGVGSMINFMPTPQGSAVRMPGTRYIEEVTGETEGRIVPFLTTSNEKSVLIFTPFAVKLVRNVNNRMEEGGFAFPEDPGTGTITYRKQIVPNYTFLNGLDTWDVTPPEYYSKGGEGPLGVFWHHGAMIMSPRLYERDDIDTCTALQTATVDVATDKITLDYEVVYFANPDTGSGGFSFQVIVSPNSDFSSPIYDETYTNTTYDTAGVTFNVSMQNVDLPTTGWTGDLYIKIEAIASETAAREFSNPQFRVKRFGILANGEAEVTEEPLTTPYTESDLKDLQYVQSPYGDKELVVVHPRHPPYQFYFNTGGGAYAFSAISFSNTPGAWAVNNYPAACTAMQGRLVLAGGASGPVTGGDPVATSSETIWATEVANWDAFSSTFNDPSDSLELTSIYRSPIQWVYGHKQGLVGSQEYEYVVRAAADILAPNDVGVFMHSTHGSANVQPAAFGEGVIFPADAGRRARLMTYSDESQGWLSKDMTLYYPEACYPKIRRMMRVRTPHQMCWILKQSGDIAIFHSENDVEGWSRFQTNNGHIVDMCTQTDDNGEDTIHLLVRRIIDGTTKLYWEAIPAFTFTRQNYGYNDCSVTRSFDTPTNVITGLDHLEGQTVQISTTRRFLGFQRVVGGEITIEDDTGEATNVSHCIVGMMHRAEMYTLPPETLDPGAAMRYSQFAVRCIASTRPIINGFRPPDRDPLTVHNVSEGLDLIRDIEVTTTGWNAYQLIEISEQIPFRCEVLGFYGHLKTGSL